ncbi:alpha/beta-hydrolase [Trametes cingulata]|nr:alpha/beta-hydrolase [Trametes cingulata]
MDSSIAPDAPSEPAEPTAAPGFSNNAYANEEYLSLPDGRTLAYSHTGPPDSDILFIWFHGLFSVGDASNPAPPTQKRNAHNISPTLPGWGNTSPPLPGKTFAETVVSDTHALLRHLRPTYDPATLRIYIAGGSFGTVPTQIVFGAPYDVFPYGRQIAGMLLMAPFSPFREHTEYRKGLSWRDWVSVGPLTQLVPRRGVQRLMKMLLKGKTSEVQSAEAFLKEEFFDTMNEQERERYAAWRARRGAKEGDFERWMAEGMVRSVSKTWEGFLGVADAIHSDWGFRVRELDEEHASKPVVLVLGKEDRSLLGMGRWLSESYKNVTVRELEGGHLAGAWSTDDVIEDLFVAGGD